MHHLKTLASTKLISWHITSKTKENSLNVQARCSCARSKAKDFLWSKVEYQRGSVKLYRCFWMWEGWMYKFFLHRQEATLVWFWTSISQSFCWTGPKKKHYQRKSYWRRLPETILWLSDKHSGQFFLEKPSRFCDRVYGHRNVKAEKCASTLIFFDFCSLEWLWHWQKPLEEHVCIWGNKLSLGMLAAASMFTNWNFFAWDLISLFSMQGTKKIGHNTTKCCTWHEILKSLL